MDGQAIPRSAVYDWHGRLAGVAEVETSAHAAGHAGGDRGSITVALRAAPNRLDVREPCGPEILTAARGHARGDRGSIAVALRAAPNRLELRWPREPGTHALARGHAGGDRGSIAVALRAAPNGHDLRGPREPGTPAHAGSHAGGDRGSVAVALRGEADGLADRRPCRGRSWARGRGVSGRPPGPRRHRDAGPAETGHLHLAPVQQARAPDEGRAIPRPERTRLR
jgi:hypothetical protein